MKTHGFTVGARIQNLARPEARPVQRITALRGRERRRLELAIGRAHQATQTLIGGQVLHENEDSAVCAGSGWGSVLAGAAPVNVPGGSGTGCLYPFHRERRAG